MQRRRAAENTARDTARRRTRVRREERRKGALRQPPEHYGGEDYDRESGVCGRSGDHPLWGCTQMFRKVWLPGVRKLQKDGEAGAHTTPVGKCRSRSVADGHVSLYEYVCRSGEVPVFTGAALRPKFPPPEGCDRAMLLLHKPWREADDLRGGPEDTRIPEFGRFLESDSCPLALKVRVESAGASKRAQRALGRP